MSKSINDSEKYDNQNEVKNKVRNFVRNFRPIFVHQPKPDEIDRNSEVFDRHATTRKAPNSRHHDYYDYSQWIPVIRRKMN